MSARSSRFGFTLIELSIVLVIIGLIVGGVLVGQDLIRAATVRAQLSQIEKFQTAVNAFYGKYGYLPGDIKDPEATSFGFIPRGSGVGQGNGNGVLEGGLFGSGWMNGSGETAVFWVDLSAAHLIEDNFTTASATALPNLDITGAALKSYFPEAKVGGGNFVYVWSGGGPSGGGYGSTGINYFGIEGIQDISVGWGGRFLNTTGNLSVLQAYQIDRKIDDGLPITGRVIAAYINFDPQWMTNSIDMLSGSPPNQTSGSTATCNDNGGVLDATEQYSIEITNGSNVNCALIFQFQ